MIRMLLVGYRSGIPPEPRLCEEIHHNWRLPFDQGAQMHRPIKSRVYRVCGELRDHQKIAVILDVEALRRERIPVFSL